MNEADFLNAIRATPGDDGLKLVYADYLDDQGDPRGQILRLSVELRKVIGENEIPEEWLAALGVREVLDLNPGERTYRCEVAGWQFSAIVRTVTPGSFTLADSGIFEVEFQTVYEREG